MARIVMAFIYAHRCKCSSVWCLLDYLADCQKPRICDRHERVMTQ